MSARRAISHWLLVVGIASAFAGFASALPSRAGAPGLRQQLAQAPATSAGERLRIRGRITALAGDRLVVATAQGEVRVTLTEPLRVTGLMAAQLSDITPETFVGTAARRQADGTFRALEVHIFPEAMRGTGEGHRPWERPDTTMTNANVEEVVQQVEGRLLVLKYKGGEARILVPPDTPIVRIVPGDRGLLKPGAGVSILAVQPTDASVSASSIIVGVDVMPPM